MEDYTSAAFYIFEEYKLIYSHYLLLRHFNTVFRAEFQAVIEAVHCAYKKSYKTVNIYSDSQTRIRSMNDLYTRNPVIRDVINYYQIKHRTKFRVA